MAKQALKKIVSPKGVASYPHLTEPDVFKGKSSFKTNLVLDPADEGVQAYLDDLKAASEAAFSEGKANMEASLSEAKGKQIKELKEKLETLRCHIPYEPEYADDGSETGRVIVKYKAVAGGEYQSGPKAGQKWERKLPLFDCEKNELDPKTLRLWGGSVIRVQAEMNPFCMPATDRAGISLRLFAVQVIEVSEGGGGSADGFGVEDGYVGEQKSAAPADQPTDDDDGQQSADDF